MKLWTIIYYAISGILDTPVYFSIYWESVISGITEPRSIYPLVVFLSISSVYKTTYILDLY